MISKSGNLEKMGDGNFAGVDPAKGREVVAGRKVSATTKMMQQLASGELSSIDWKKGEFVVKSAETEAEKWMQDKAKDRLVKTGRS